MTCRRPAGTSCPSSLNFGRVEGLIVRGGDPVLSPRPCIVREFKFAGENSPRPEGGLATFALKKQHLDLFALLDSIGDGMIHVLTIKHGLPFHAELPG
ncbi:hypothetical protein [Fimbriiglobus ruber]|uniref:Uncharacterized protein n=1 Tax=Fimbriiglobus ruber TaxID=1908690 RepID=A0A225DPK7_9BACT|nr:hypothetical protein [Fimbriiglobus ruber]OWK39416.1 hypothetical protein FRUB_05979 [Fimbriiglobus ruber]